MYSYKNQPPAPLPDRIRLLNGSTRTDPSTFTDEEILQSGYVKITQEKPVPTSVYQTVQWNGYAWELVDVTDEERQLIDTIQWKYVRVSRDRRIQEVAWRVERYNSEVRLGMQPTEDIYQLDTYIQALRDITTQTDPFNIVWPQEP